MVKRTFRTISKEDAEIIYDTVTKTKSGRYRGISKAARKIGVSRQTIYDFLDAQPSPKKSRKLQPKYVGDFQDTEGYEKIQHYNKHIRKVKAQTARNRIMFARRCWLFLDKKDPINWTKEDYRKLTMHEKWFNKNLQPPQLPLGKLVMIRSFMAATGKHAFIADFPTKGSKAPKGQKRHWYLNYHQVKAIRENIDDFETTVLFIMACYTGNRIGTYLKSTWRDLHLDAKFPTWEAFESKTGTPNTNELNMELVEILELYKSYMEKAGKVGANKRMFPHSKGYYTKRLRKGARTAGLLEKCWSKHAKREVDYCIAGEPLSWHITRHTFASLLAQNQVPLQHIMEQGPWSDASTLLDFYAGVDRTQVRESMDKLKLI